MLLLLLMALRLVLLLGSARPCPGDGQLCAPMRPPVFPQCAQVARRHRKWPWRSLLRVGRRPNLRWLTSRWWWGRSASLLFQFPLLFLHLVVILLQLALLVLLTVLRRRWWWARCAMLQLPCAHVDAILLRVLPFLVPFLLLLRLLSVLLLLQELLLHLRRLFALLFLSVLVPLLFSLVPPCADCSPWAWKS